MVNRVRIEIGQWRQSIHSRFRQRGRTLMNEYLVKWCLFWDALPRQLADA